MLEKLEKQVSHPDVKSGKDNIVMFNFLTIKKLFANYKLGGLNKKSC
jgi:hypothetical protein